MYHVDLLLADDPDNHFDMTPRSGSAAVAGNLTSRERSRQGMRITGWLPPWLLGKEPRARLAAFRTGRKGVTCDGSLAGAFSESYGGLL